MESPRKKLKQTEKRIITDVTRRSSIISDSETSEINQISSDENDESDYYDIETLPRFQLRGRTWNLFKPIGNEMDTLYPMILQNPREVEDLALTFIVTCDKKPVESLFMLIKFCLDCADCQNFDLVKYTKYPPDLVRIIKKVDNDHFPSPALERGKILLAETSKLGKVLTCAICTFIQKFVLAAHETRYLYTGHFKFFIKFLSLMCEATYWHLWYTGNMLSIKILTSICDLKHNLSEEKQSGFDRVNTFLDYFYVNFMRSSKVSDKKCASLKVTALRELRLWINFCPWIFIGHFQCISFVVQYFVFNEVISIRLSALSFFKKLVKDSQVDLKGEPIKTIIYSVGGRLEDIEGRVVLAALDTLGTIATKYTAEALEHRKYFRALLECMYDSNYEVAKQAGWCIAQLLKHEYGDNEVEILIELAQLSTRKCVPMLVEACIESQPVLQNWSLIIDILVDDNYQNVAEKEAISELALEAAHQILYGQSTQPRITPRQEVNVNILNHRQLANELLPFVRQVLVLNRNQPKIVCNFLKIIVEIDAKVMTNAQCQYLEELSNDLKKLFDYLKDDQALEAVCEVLLYCSEQVAQLQLTFGDLVENITNQYTKELTENLQSPDAKTVICAKKVSILFRKFNLTRELQWPTLHDSWDIMETNNEFLESMIVCCSWSLIWHIRRLNSVTGAERDKLIEHVKNSSKDFGISCFNLIGQGSAERRIMVFRQICKTYSTFGKECDQANMAMSLLNLTELIINDSQLLKVFLSAFENCIVGNDKIPSVERQQIAMDIMNMALIKILPVTVISTVFKYYDKYYNLYARPIETMISHLSTASEDQLLPTLVIYAFTQAYEDILEKDGVVDIRRQTAKDLLNMSIRFAECRSIKTIKCSCKLLVLAINYSIFRKQYDYLIFMKPFAVMISKCNKEKREILDYLQEKIPKSDMKNDSVLYFVNHLKKLAPGRKGSGRKKNR